MPKRLERSVSASAGMLSDTAFATASSTRTMPSTMEYSLCKRRWTKLGEFDMTCRWSLIFEERVVLVRAYEKETPITKLSSGPKYNSEPKHQFYTKRVMKLQWKFRPG